MAFANVRSSGCPRFPPFPLGFSLPGFSNGFSNGRNTPAQWLSASSGPNRPGPNVRGIEQPIALQILKTLARYTQTGKGNTKQLRDIEPPLIRLRAQHHRVFFCDKGGYLEISRVLDRKEAYRSERGRFRLTPLVPRTFAGATVQQVTETILRGLAIET